MKKKKRKRKNKKKEKKKKVYMFVNNTLSFIVYMNKPRFCPFKRKMRA